MSEKMHAATVRACAKLCERMAKDNDALADKYHLQGRYEFELSQRSGAASYRNAAQQINQLLIKEGGKWPIFETNAPGGK